MSLPLSTAKKDLLISSDFELNDLILILKFPRLILAFMPLYQ